MTTSIPDEGRRYNRAETEKKHFQGSHKIAIGCTIFSQKANKDIPQKLNGFAVFRDSVGDGGRLLDMQCMTRLGCPNEAAIREAFSKGIKFDQSPLPHSLDFLLPADVRKANANASWDISSVFVEQYQDFKQGGMGCFCSGNGIEAMRQQGDGSTKRITCNPVGKAGIDAANFCKESVSGECKVRVELLLDLIYHNKTTNRYDPVSAMMNARYVFRTTIEKSGIWISSAIRDAADLLAIEQPDGSLVAHLYGLNGTLVFGTGKSPYKDKDGKVKYSIVPKVTMFLNAAQIRDRLRARHEAEMKGKLLVSPVDVKPNEGGVGDVLDLGDIEIDEDSDESPQPEKKPQPQTPPKRAALPPPPPPADFNPFDQGQESSPSNIIPVADATPDELADALKGYIQGVASSKNVAFAEVSKEICDPVTVKGIEYKCADPLNYLKAKGDDAANAQAALRATCERIEKSGDERFVVLSAAKGGTAE